jgi:hypothetical protein
MGSLTPSAVKTSREKGARFIHALTCEEDMGKRKVKNSLPPAALEKKAQSKRTLLNIAKDRPERRSFLYGRSEVIRTPGILLPKQARYQLRYTPIRYSLCIANPFLTALIVYWILAGKSTGRLHIPPE